MLVISMDSVPQDAGMITLIKFLFVLDDYLFCPFSHIPLLNIDVQYCRSRGVFNCKMSSTQHLAFLLCLYLSFIYWKWPFCRADCIFDCFE